MTDPNTDQAILDARTDAARLSDCASAVDHRGRREVTACEVRRRRAIVIPPCNDDEKPEITTIYRGRRYTVDPNDRCNIIVSDIEGKADGDPPTAT